jgi:hypothetical protein
MRGTKVRRVYVTGGADAVAMTDRSTRGMHSVELDTGLRITEGVQKIVKLPERL